MYLEKMKREKGEILSCLPNFLQLSFNIDLPKKTCYVVKKHMCVIEHLFKKFLIQKFVE